MTWFVVVNLIVAFFMIAARALRADLRDMRRWHDAPAPDKENHL